MGALKIAITVVFILVCIARVVVVLMQEGKSRSHKRCSRDLLGEEQGTFHGGTPGEVYQVAGGMLYGACGDTESECILRYWDRKVD